jgi:hypothetical protein
MGKHDIEIPDIVISSLSSNSPPLDKAPTTQLGAPRGCANGFRPHKSRLNPLNPSLRIGAMPLSQSTAIVPLTPPVEEQDNDWIMYEVHQPVRLER